MRTFLGPAALALGELRTLTSLLQTVLLTLDRTRIAGEVAGLLKVITILASLKKSASDAQAKCAGLTIDAAAIAVCEDQEYQ